MKSCSQSERGLYRDSSGRRASPMSPKRGGRSELVPVQARDAAEVAVGASSSSRLRALQRDPHQ